MPNRIPVADAPICSECLGSRDNICPESWDADFTDAAWESWCGSAAEIAEQAWEHCEVLGALIMLRTSTPEFEPAIAAIEATETVRILGFSLLLLTSFVEEYDVDVEEIFAEVDEEEALGMIRAAIFGDEAILGDMVTEFGFNLV